MTDREKLLELVRQEINNDNIVKHMLAMEAFMKGLAEELGKDQAKWGKAGLIHDLDYQSETDPAEHGIKIRQILAENDVAIEEDVLQAIAAHNWHNNGVEPQAPLDWALFCGDSLTGLVVASTLVLPDKQLSSLTVESVIHKFPRENFAAGARRKDIKMAEEKLGIPLERFVEICLTRMRGVSDKLGL